MSADLIERLRGQLDAITPWALADDIRALLDALAAKERELSAVKSEAIAATTRYQDAENDLHTAEAALSEMRAERDAMLARCRTAEADLELWQIQANNRTAELERAIRALEPFARRAFMYDGQDDDWFCSPSVQVKHLRAARALSQDEPADLGVGG